MEQTYRITNLQIENIKRIKAIDVTPQKDLVVIEGKNKAGKTSLMDSISYLLGGKILIPEQPIRTGEKEGYVEANFGDFTISRKWSNPYTSTLKIKTADGSSPGSPQAWLDEKIGSFALEVAELMNMKKDDRITVFKRITGLKLDDLKVKYERVQDDKRLEARRLEGLKKELSTLDDLPEKAETENFDALQEERKKKDKENDEYYTKMKDEEIKSESLQRYEDELLQINNRINELKLTLEGAEKDKKNVELFIGESEKVIIQIKEEKEKMPTWDLSEIDERMKKSNDAIELQYKYKRKETLATDVLVLGKEIEGYVVEMDKIKKEKSDRIKNTKLPIEGLEFDGDVIRYNNIEFEECSTAERIEIALAVAVEENPNIRVLLIREGSSLDESAVKRVKKLAKEHNFQIWIETVHSSDSSAIHIEEGEIKKGE
ncbi:hypothetical protein LCGC14_1963660 [marine sediment metagenome]|uniref:Rad50/SbcC-type AAA domain-containing protein n=1 Tax=marine sediment metagenome TaxID=412755 RepID=A0A0F9FDR3_9ZZZZ